MKMLLPVDEDIKVCAIWKLKASTFDAKCYISNEKPEKVWPLIHYL